ncbi:MAG: hypothetical protein AAGM22_12760 [Acidobacteriota bacterium]
MSVRKSSGPHFVLLLCFVVLSAAAWVIPAAAQTPSRDALSFIDSNQVTAGDRFGSAVATDGTVLAVGAPFDDGAGNFTGVVHIFRRVGLAWLPEAYVAAPSFQSRTGYAIAVSDGAVAISDYGLARVDIHRHDGAQWVIAETIFGPPTGRFRFAQAIDMEGDDLIVQSIDIQLGGVSVDHYRFDGAAWTLATTLNQADGENASYGALDITGDRLIAGDWRVAGGVGHAVVAERDPATGEFFTVQVLQPAGLPANTFFGWSAAIDGDTAVVGTPYASFDGDRAGSVFVYIRDSAGQWIETQRLSASNARDGLGFGSGVDLDGDRLLIGARDGTFALPTEAGEAFVFDRDPVTGLFVETLHFEVAGVTDKSFIGESVALGDDLAYVGGSFFNADRGGAWAFAFEETARPPQVQLDPIPACVASSPLAVGGTVSSDEEISSVAGSVDGGAPQTLCRDCGLDPSFSYAAPLAACDNTIEVSAEDVNGVVGLNLVTTRLDGEGPVLTCPDDIFVNAQGTVAEVFFPTPTAVDGCDGAIALPCRRSDADFVQPGDEDKYRRGTASWSCPVRDACNNFSTCGFSVTVLPQGAALPAPGCDFKDFRDLELLDAPVFAIFKEVIGTSTRIREVADGAGVDLEIETGPFGGVADNAYFLYRKRNEDFRLETPVPSGGFGPVGVGGAMVRWGLEPSAARASIALRPGGGGIPVLELSVRTAAGQNAVALGADVSAVGVTDVALEVEGNRVTAQYSNDGGATWVTPAGAAATVAAFGEVQAGIFASSEDLANRTTFTFPYLELCPILGVDPGTEPPPPSVGGACQADDFEDDTVGTEWTLSGVGNANQLSVGESGGSLALTADGATAFTGDDNLGVLYRELAGDFRMEVTVDGSTMTTGGAFRKAGLTIRPTLDDGAPRLLAQLAPFWNNADETHLQWVARRTQDGPGNIAVATDVIGVPRQVRLAIERAGDEFEVQFSIDGGATWTTPGGGLGGRVTIAMPETVLVGLNVVSNNISVTSTALFDDFQICSPCVVVDDHDDGVVDPAWILTGVGNANQQSVSESGGVLALTADGATAFFGADNAGFLYREVDGDFRLESTVDGSTMTTGGLYRKAGLMVRTGLDPWDIRLIAQLAPFWENRDETHLQFVARDAFGAPGRLPVSRDVVGVPRVVRLAIERRGDVLSVQYSTDGGATWIRPTTGLGGSITIANLPQTLLMGLDMVSNNISVTSTALFDDTSICTLR